MFAGKFPVDLVLFGMIALFLVLRLRSILGRSQGFEGLPDAKLRYARGPVIEGRAEQAPAAAPRALPDPAGDTGRVLASMQAIDRQFTPAAFLTGAEAAFRLIVTAFAAGDREKLKPLLTPDTYAAFEAALTAREAAGQTQRTQIRSILEAQVDHASLMGTLAEITVRFVSQQIAITTAPDGTVVAGADAVMELVDVWSFSRDLKQQAAMWRLSAAHSA